MASSFVIGLCFGYLTVSSTSSVRFLSLFDEPIGFIIFKLLFIFLKEKLVTLEFGCFVFSFAMLRCICRLSSLGLKLLAELKDGTEAIRCMTGAERSPPADFVFGCFCSCSGGLYPKMLSSVF